MKIETLKILLPEEDMSKYISLVPENRTPLWAYWSEFVTHYLREGRSEVTIKGVRDILKSIIKNINILSLEDCNNPQILREALFKAKEANNWSNVTFNTYRKNLNTYFLWLATMGYIELNNISKIRKCKEEINEQHTLNEENVKLLLGHMQTRRQTRLERQRDKLFMLLLIYTGARPCELLQLQFRDIEPQKDHSYKLIIRGRKQKGRIRYYMLPSWIKDAFETYVSVRQDLNRNELNLFVSSSKRTGWTDKGMAQLFKKLSKELGFRVNAYSIRRFVATNLYLKGKSLEEIGEYLGHTRASTTKRYIAKQCALTKECGEVMSNTISESS